MRLLTFCLLLISSVAYSQTVVLSVDRKAESVIPDKGPNMKKFTHFFIRAAAIASPDKEGAKIIYGPSVNLAFGVRSKFKIGSVYSLGFEIENEYTDYKFKQEKGKIVPDTIINDVGRLDYSTLCLGFFNRFNLDPNRGNFLGHYVDIGIAGEWHYSIKSISKNDMPDGTLEKTTMKHLNYVYNLNTKAVVRIGFSHLSYIYVSYRLMDVFKPGYGYPDLPRIIAGMELAIF